MLSSASNIVFKDMQTSWSSSISTIRMGNSFQINSVYHLIKIGANKILLRNGNKDPESVITADVDNAVYGMNPVLDIGKANAGVVF